MTLAQWFSEQHQIWNITTAYYTTNISSAANYTFNNTTLNSTKVNLVSHVVTDGSTSTATLTLTDHGSTVSGDKNEDQTGLLIGTIIQLIGLPFCLFGNIMIIAALCKHKKLLRHHSNLYIVSLTIADLLVGALLVPFEMLFNIHELLESDALHYSAICVTHRFLVAFLLGASLAAMLMISVDRYIAVIHPFFYTEKMTATVIKRTIMSTWLFLFIACSFIFLSLTSKPNEWHRHCGFPCPEELQLQGQVYAVILYIVLLGIFLGNLVLYAWVAKTALKKYLKSVNEIKRSRLKHLYNRGELNNTKVIVTMFGLFIIFWLPYMVVLLLHISGVCKVWDNMCMTSRDITLSLGIFNSSLNCYVYAWRKKDFKSVIQMLLCAACKQNKIVPSPPDLTKTLGRRKMSVASIFVTSKLSSKRTELTMLATCQSSHIDSETSYKVVPDGERYQETHS